MYQKSIWAGRHKKNPRRTLNPHEAVAGIRLLALTGRLPARR